MHRWVVCGVKDGHAESGTLAVAASLAERTGSRLAVVSVQPDADDPHERRNLRTCGGFALTRAALLHDLTDDATCRVEFGDPAAALASVAASLGAAFIVIGGPRRRPRVLRGGSVMNRLLSTSDQPLIIVPPGSGNRFRLGIGLGGSLVCGVRGPDGHIAEFGAGLARDLGVRPLFVTAMPASATGGLAPIFDASAAVAEEELIEADVRQRLTAVANGALTDAEAVVERGGPARALESVAERRRACAIVVRSDNRSWIERVVRGSVCRALCRSGRRPVFVVPQAR
jgi:nucleotide-binding universal stress UspA family protein